MNLLLDIGNTRMKWAVQHGEELSNEEPLVHKGRAFKDVAQEAWNNLAVPDRVIISCVAGPNMEKKVKAWMKKTWKVSAEILQAQDSVCGVTNAYNKPGRLGADRWASLLAVHAHYPGIAMIVDCGTAITVDALAADGRHLGGLIVPGMDMMAAALTENAANIDLGELESADVSVLGSSTESAVSGGVLYAAVAFVERVFADLQAEMQNQVKLIISGGDAQRIIPLLSCRSLYDANLVLKGLAVFSEETVGCVT